ncbi:MAG: hypothetical protein RLW62_11815, partial [Gammaproteobacteria bacterium]
MFRSLSAWLAAGALLCAASAAMATAIDARAPLVSALGALRAADAATRASFVEVAVEALTARHYATLGNATTEASWARGTRAYLARLQATARAARGGARVMLINDPREGLRVIVGGPPAHQFVLAPPRPGERATLERDVLLRLCMRIPCTGGTPPVATALRAAAVPVAVPERAAGAPAASPLARPAAAPAQPAPPAPPPGRADGVVAVLPDGADG